MSVRHLTPGPGAPAHRGGPPVPQPPPCEEHRRADGVDFADITEAEDVMGLHGPTGRPMDEVLDDARAVCAGCPGVRRCRTHVLRVEDPGGFVGGMTEQERRDWRSAHGVPAPRPRLWWALVHTALPDTTTQGEDADTTTRGHLLLDLSTETRASRDPREITVEEILVVAHLTREGWSAETIAERLVTRRSVPGKDAFHEDVPWTVDRVEHARAVLAGSQGHASRRVIA